MKNIVLIIGGAAILSSCGQADAPKPRVELPHDTSAHIMKWTPTCQLGGEWTMTLHGGAGVIVKKNFTPEKERAYREALSSTLQTGADMLKGGTGEYFIRAGIARDVCARREYKGEELQTAMDAIIHGTLTDMGGDGGIVALDNDGNFAYSFNTAGYSFNTAGMYRGAVRHNMPVAVHIFKED